MDTPKKHKRKKKHHGEKRKANDKDPAVIDTPLGPILVYRLPLGAVSFVYPPGKGIRLPKPKERKP